MMEFTMVAGSVPAGNYRAAFLGADPYRENVAQYGEGVLLKWRVIGGEHDGEEASRICSAKLTPKTALGKFASAFKGGVIATGERFSFAHFVGAQGSLIVEPTENGGSRVSAFLRDAQQPPAAPAQPVPQPAPTPVQPQSAIVAQPQPVQQSQPVAQQIGGQIAQQQPTPLAQPTQQQAQERF